MWQSCLFSSWCLKLEVCIFISCRLFSAFTSLAYGQNNIFCSSSCNINKHNSHTAVPFMWCLLRLAPIIGASLSEPHINETSVCELCFYMFISLWYVRHQTSCRRQSKDDATNRGVGEKWVRGQYEGVVVGWQLKLKSLKMESVNQSWRLRKINYERP